MSTFDGAVSALKDFLLMLGNSKKEEPRHLKSLYNLLYAVYQAIDEASDSSLVNNSNLAVLEDVCVAKNFSFSKTIMTVVTSIYGKLSKKTPGYGIRTVIGNHLNLLNGKAVKLSNLSQECCVLVIGEMVKLRSNDCGALLTDVFQTVIRVLKSSDPTPIRIACLRTLKFLIIGNGPGISENHIEALKIITKFISDRNPEMRLIVAECVVYVCHNSKSFESAPSDFLIQSLAKGLEDEVAVVQDAYASATAQVYIEQIKIYTAMQEANKVNASRGGSAEDPKKSNDKKQSTSKMLERLSITKMSDLKSVLSGTPKKSEDVDFKTVVSLLTKSICKSVGTLRVAYIAVLAYIIRDLISTHDDDTINWTYQQIIGILSDPAIAVLPHEDILFIRARLSFLIRDSMSTILNETGQIKLAGFMINYLASVETRSDHELQLALFELSQIICVLGDASKSMIDDINLAVNAYIRHSSFGVRSASAYVLSSISRVAPSMAHQIISQALSNAQSQIKQLLVFEKNEEGSSQAVQDEEAISQHGGGASSASNDATESLPNPSPSPLTSSSELGPQAPVRSRKSPKDSERMQRMYCFHGQILVMSLILKNEQNIRTGISKGQVSEIFEFGLTLLKHNLSVVPAGFRNIICSIVRAGSLIVSSCLNLNFIYNQSKVYSLLSCCHEIIKIATGSSAAHEDEILYEIMIIEAGLVCISTIIWRHADLVASDETCRDWIVESLECSFRSLKSKYQPKFRANFRFRTLHCILLESFAWLPPVFFSNSSQQVFVEALRVFRDCLSAGNECSCLDSIIPDEFSLLGLNSGNKVFGDVPDLDRQFILKVENFSIPLQKKESEAFLAVFGKDSLINIPSPSNQYSSLECPWFAPVSPSADIDSRTIDAAIMTIASTCSIQSHEYQDKAMQLFTQAITQVTKPPTNSISVFTSSEESRRREKRNYVTLKNVVAALCYMMRSLPIQKDDSEIKTLTWIPNIVDRLFSIMVFNFWDVKLASSYALSTLFSKVEASKELIESFYSRIQKMLTSALEKKGENMSEYIGHVLLLGNLWIVGDHHDLLRVRIIATLLDCLRRLDTSLSFKSSVFLSLFLVCDHLFAIFQKSGPEQLSEWFSLLENIAHVMELHVAVVTTSVATSNSNPQAIEDLDMFFASASKLNSSLGPLSLGCLPKSQSLLSIVQTSFKIFDISSRISSVNCSQITKSNLLYINRIIPVFPNISKNMESVSNDVSSLINWNVILTSWFSIIENREHFPLKFLKLIVDGINLAAKFSPSIMSQCNADMYLFSLLNWMFSFQCAAPASALTGLESRLFYNLDFVSLDVYNGLISSIEEAITTLISSEISKSPDTKALYWFLCCRALTLGLRSSGSAAVTENEEKENEEQVSESQSGHSNMLEIFQSKILFSGSSSQELLAKFREIAIGRMQPVASNRYMVKAFAVKCSALALSEFDKATKDSKDRDVHIQLAAARDACTKNISSISKASSPSIFDFPSYLILFLHDLINMACSNATYSINDKISSNLLEESTLLLEKLIAIFSSSRDPDFISNGNQQANSKEDKLLNQYISQLISAIRPSMSEAWHPTTFKSAGHIVINLLQTGLIRDKNVAKRLAKSLLSFAEDNNDIIGSFQKNPSVGEEVYTEKYVINSFIASKLYLLANGSPSNLLHDVDKSIKEAMLQVIEPTLLNLFSFWKGIFVDSSRINLLSDKNNNSSMSSRFEGLGYDIDSIHPQRGGHSYSYMADISRPKLRSLYAEVGNLSLVAAVTSFCSLSQINQDAKLQSELFILLCLSLKNALANVESEIDFSILAELVNSFYLLSDVKSVASAVSVSEWNTVLQEIRNSGVLSHKDVYAQLYIPLVSLIESLSRLFPSSEADATLSVELSNLENQLLLTMFQYALVATTDSKNGFVTLNVTEFTSNDITKLGENISSFRMELIFNSLAVHIGLICNKSSSSLNSWSSGQVLIRLLLVVSVFWPQSIQARSTIISNICSALLSEKYLTLRPRLMARLLDDLSSFDASPEVAGKISLAADTFIGVWALMCNNSDESVPVLQPTLFSKFVWNVCSNESSEVQKALSKSAIVSLTKLIQSDTRNCYSILSNTLCPSLFTVLKISCTHQVSLQSFSFDDQSLLLLLQCTFVIYSRLAEDKKFKFISLLFPILCDLWSFNSNNVDVENSQWGVFVGIAITALARNTQELVRDAVTQLSDQHKAVLQTIIKCAMARQQSLSQQQSAASNQSSAGSAVKKIDLSKFKKADS